MMAIQRHLDEGNTRVAITDFPFICTGLFSSNLPEGNINTQYTFLRGLNNQRTP